MNKHTRAAICYAVGWFGYKIFRFQMLAHGFNEGQTYAWTNGFLVILFGWITWNWFRHKDDTKKQEEGFQKEFHEALEKNQESQK
jgi:hypothetical protein